MPAIDESWLRHAFGAMSAMLDVDTRLRNEMIQFLIDEGFWKSDNFKDFDSAIAKWGACKNPNKSEFFKVGELWALAMRFGRHQLFLAVMEDLGYEAPRLRTTEERRLALLEKLDASNERHQQELQDIRAELKRLVPQIQPEAGARAGRPSFSLAAASPATAVENLGSI